MAGKIRHLLNRDGRYFARIVIPKELRPFLDRKTELRTPLGPDRRAALARLASAVATLQIRISEAEAKRAAASGTDTRPGRFPLNLEQIALRHYQAFLEFDAEIRQTDHRYANLDPDIHYVDMAADLRAGMAGKLTNQALEQVIGHRVEHFRRAGNTDAARGTPEWRDLAMHLCAAEYEILLRVVERNEGDFTGKPTHPVLIKALAEVENQEATLPPVSLIGLFADYCRMKALVGKGREAQRRWTPVFEDLRKFLRHDDARRLTKQDVADWRNAKLETLSPKTVADVYLASLRTVLSWAVEEGRLDTNAAEKVRQEVPKKRKEREQGFTDAEALTVLRTVRAYAPAKTDNPRTTEEPHTTAAKQWAPVLCAFSGARIGEITQLRKQDIRKEGDTYIMRLSPAAGTVKAGNYRDVPLHPQVIELGFMHFVDLAVEGPLFHKGGSKDPITAARTVAGRVSKWLQSIGVIPEGVSPQHGWRHRFKTVAWEHGINPRVVDAIQGHAARTAGENYGDVTIAARKAAINRLPDYDL